jgi:NAD(P)-dependent dehydrogenase (short-subunit alcohol dehydrogenase family)
MKYSHDGITRVAVITGAANGLGKAMALGLLGRGFAVVAVDRDRGGLEALCSPLPEAHLPNLATVAADLTSFDAAQLSSQVIEPFGRVDILINNAGIGQGQVRPDYHTNPPKFYEVTPQQWQSAIAVNATAVFLLSRELVLPMIERRWGRIINITTSLGTMLRGGSTPYGPTKASAEALSAVMAADLEGTGVTTNVVIPGGIVNTPMIPWQAPFRREELLKPDVMLPSVYWLCSDEANDVTGRRFLGIPWDAAKPADVASQEAGAPIGWKDLAVQPIRPPIKR